jgi:hypothetical protein
MRTCNRRTSFIPALFLLIITSFAGTSQAQTISPPPTAAGYPFWKTNFDPGKITRGNDGAVWFAGNNGILGRLSLTGSLKNFTVEPLNSQNGEGAILGIYWGPDNNVWYGTFSGIVGKLNPTTGTVTRFQLPEHPYLISRADPTEICGRRRAHQSIASPRRELSRHFRWADAIPVRCCVRDLTATCGSWRRVAAAFIT